MQCLCSAGCLKAAKAAASNSMQADNPKACEVGEQVSPIFMMCAMQAAKRAYCAQMFKSEITI
jgi:hypothetical protein